MTLKLNLMIVLSIIFGILITSCGDISIYETDPDNIETENNFIESHQAPCPPFCDLTVSIEGAQTIYLNSTETYSANISGGTSPYDYLWNYTLLDCTGGDCSDEGIRKFGSNNSTFDFTNEFSNYDTVRIEVWITDDESKDGYSLKDVNLSNDIK